MPGGGGSVFHAIMMVSRDVPYLRSTGGLLEWVVAIKLLSSSSRTGSTGRHTWICPSHQLSHRIRDEPDRRLCHPETRSEKRNMST